MERFSSLAYLGRPLAHSSISDGALEGKGLVSQLAEATEADTKANQLARESLVKSLRGITELYPNRIWKEEYLAFPMADKILSSKNSATYLRNSSWWKRFEQFAEGLERKAQRT